MTLIEQLKQRATEEHRSHGAFGELEIHREVNLNKLIELVAAECAAMIEDTPCYSNTDHYYIADNIKEKFGITE